MNVIQKHVLKRNEIDLMTDRELLEELVEEKRREETWRILDLIWKIVIIIAVLILCYHFLPSVINFFRELYEMVQSIKQAADSIQKGISEVSGAFGGLFGSLN